MRNFGCSTLASAHIGRSILASDGSPITEGETSREACATGYASYSLRVLTWLPDTHPPQLQDAPELGISTGSDEIETVLYRFVVWDDGQDVVVQDPRRMSLDDITSVIVTNNSLDPPETVYAWYGNSALQAELGPGAFVAEVPMLLPDGAVSHPNELRVHAVDSQGNELSQDVVVVRQAIEVMAEIGSVDPPSALPNQLVTFDGTTSLVPGLDLPDGGVVQWAFFKADPGSTLWNILGTTGPVTGPGALTATWAMPPNQVMRARLVVAKDLASLPDSAAVMNRYQIPCQWSTDGSCDTAEVVVEMSDPDCYSFPHPVDVSVIQPVDAETGITPEGAIVLDAEADPNDYPAEYAVTYRWVVYDTDGTVVTYLGSGDDPLCQHE
jgi:hypothetical protein